MASAPSAPAGEAASGSNIAHQRGALGRSVDAAAVAAFGVAWCSAAVGLGEAVSLWEGAILVGVALPLGHLLADLLSGLLHWFADEFFEEDTPVLGPALIFGFRDHHRNPRDILAHGLLEVSGYNALATLPVLLALLAWPPVTGAAQMLHAAVLATALSIALTNQFHRFAHAEHVPRAVRWLQRAGLVLSPEAHAGHHRAGDRAYCVTAGWCNRPLDGLGLLPAVGERVHRFTRWVRWARD